MAKKYGFSVQKCSEKQIFDVKCPEKLTFDVVYDVKYLENLIFDVIFDEICFEKLSFSYEGIIYLTYF